MIVHDILDGMIIVGSDILSNLFYRFFIKLNYFLISNIYIYILFLRFTL